MRLATALAMLAACSSNAQPPADSSTADAQPSLHLATSSELCKLLSNRNTSDPTPNDVQHRANVLGADLGIPVEYGDQLFLFFGDTIGFAGIWGGGESHPDAVGHGADPASAIAAQPNLLCSDLQIATLAPAQSIGPQVDPSVEADFAGAAMTAPAGSTLGDFIHDPAGSTSGTMFQNLPGDFEVPSGAFSAGDSIYVFYTTVVTPNDLEMKASYLAQWKQPTAGGPPDYQILYPVDERFDGSGALHGDFINIAAEVSGDYVYLFGTGAYRASGVHLARKRLDALATPGDFEDLGMIITTPGYGETSVRYFPEVDRWMLLAEESLPASNRIVAYFAQHPEGPWSAPVTVHDMADPAFAAKYCCTTDDNCAGQQMFNCDRTGFYGTYLLPTVMLGGDAFTVTYTMSSFSPYNVALFQTTFSERTGGD
jgi:Domain of unknown function (DUF4185)